MASYDTFGGGFPKRAEFMTRAVELQKPPHWEIVKVYHGPETGFSVSYIPKMGDSLIAPADMPSGGYGWRSDAERGAAKFIEACYLALQDPTVYDKVLEANDG